MKNIFNFITFASCLCHKFSLIYMLNVDLHPVDNVGKDYYYKIRERNCLHYKIFKVM